MSPGKGEILFSYRRIKRSVLGPLLPALGSVVFRDSQTADEVCSWGLATDRTGAISPPGGGPLAGALRPYGAQKGTDCAPAFTSPPQPEPLGLTKTRGCGRGVGPQTCQEHEGRASGLFEERQEKALTVHLSVPVVLGGGEGGRGGKVHGKVLERHSSFQRKPNLEPTNLNDDLYAHTTTTPTRTLWASPGGPPGVPERSSDLLPQGPRGARRSSEDTAGGRLRRVLHTWAPDVFTRRDGGVSTARGRGAGKRAARAKGNSGGRVQRGYQGWGRVPVCSVYVPGYWAGADSKSVSWASEDKDLCP
ncbi:unnamed protein product [Arctogadus glacialis]